MLRRLEPTKLRQPTRQTKQCVTLLLPESSPLLGLVDQQQQAAAMVSAERCRLCISIKRRSTLGLAVMAFCLYASEIAFAVGTAVTLWGAYSFLSMKQAEFATTSASYGATMSDLQTWLARLDIETSMCEKQPVISAAPGTAQSC
jgi:hypothetical protein